MDPTGLLLAALVVAGWSFPGVFVRLMPQLNPWAIAVLRLSVGFVFTLPIALSKHNRADFLMVVRSPISWAVATIMFVYYVAATAAFQNAPVGEVALLIASAPALALPLRLFVGIKPTFNEFLGTVLALSGVACVLTPGADHAHYAHPALGPVLALTAALCAASFAIGVRSLTVAGRPASPLALASLTQALGLVALPFVLVVTPHKQLDDHRTWWVVPMGAFSTAVPTACYAAAAGRLPPVVATMINPMVAVSATVVATIAIGESPRWVVIPAAMLIAAGMLVSTRSKS